MRCYKLSTRKFMPLAVMIEEHVSHLDLPQGVVPGGKGDDGVDSSALVRRSSKFWAGGRHREVVVEWLVASCWRGEGCGGVFWLCLSGGVGVGGMWPPEG